MKRVKQPAFWLWLGLSSVLLSSHLRSSPAIPVYSLHGLSIPVWGQDLQGICCSQPFRTFPTQFPSSAGEQSRAASPPLTVLFFLRRVVPNLHGWQLCCPSEVTFSAGLVIFEHKLLESASCHRVTRLQTPGCSKLVFNTSGRLFRCFTQLLSPSLRFYSGMLCQQNVRSSK